MHAAGGDVENIGDITAKGGAQIAVVDLLGIASGIFLSRESASLAVAVPPSSRTVPPSLTARVLPVACKAFNLERMYSVLGKLLLDDNATEDASGHLPVGHTNSTGTVLLEPQCTFTGHIPTPEQIAATEKMFLPQLDALINDIFRGEKYFLVVGRDVKNKRGWSAQAWQWVRRRKGRTRRAGTGRWEGEERALDPQEQCHIVLHADAK